MPRIALCLGLLLSLPQPAGAQDTSAVLAEARDALAMGEPGRALELARISRVLDPESAPEALVLMGRASLALAHPAAAQRLFRRALDRADPPTRAAALRGITTANAGLATLRIDVHPAHARVTIDGEPVEWERGQRIVLVPVGHHEIIARAPGHETRQLSRTLTAEGMHELHFLLTPGDEERIGSVGTRASSSPVRHWLSGNLFQTGLGAAGVGAAALWAADAARRVRGGSQGARLELDYAHYELGVSLGLALASQGHLAFYDVNEGRTAMLVEIGATMLFFAGSVASGLVAASRPGESPEARLISGIFAGGAASALGNLALDRRGGNVAVSLLLTSFGVAFSHLPVMLDAATAGRGLPGYEDLQAYGAQLTMGSDACAAVAAGDTQSGTYAGQMGALNATCDQLASLDRVTGVAVGVALGSAALSLGTGLVMLATEDDGDGLDVSVAAGPSSLQVSGQF